MLPINHSSTADPSSASRSVRALLDAFERELAELCDVRHAVGVSSGTDALGFALIASGVRPGDTVVSVPNTFIATGDAISQANARPAFVDIDEATYTMDPRKLEQFLATRCVRDPATGQPVHLPTGSPVTAVVPVHMYGQMADMDPILELAAAYNLIVIEDAGQAPGAEYFSAREGRWCKAGSMGHAAAFSFYPGENTGTYGEAGAVTTNNLEVARQCRMLRACAQPPEYLHEIEAGILRAKLAHLAEWNELRRARAREYDVLFAGSFDVVRPVVPRWSHPVYHLYVVRVPDREAVQHGLLAAGINTGMHYPVPLHLCRPYRNLGYRSNDFPIAEQASREVLSLPMDPELSSEDQRVVASTLRELATAHSQTAVWHSC